MPAATGNMWALQERVVAAGSLEGLAAQLRQSKAALQALILPAQHAGLDAFFTRTVDAAGKGGLQTVLVAVCLESCLPPVVLLLNTLQCRKFA